MKSSRPALSILPNLNRRVTILLSNLEPHGQKLRNHRHVGARVHVGLLGGERTRASQRQWQQLIRQMLARNRPLDRARPENIAVVDEEIARLNHSWSDPRNRESETRLRELIGGDRLGEMDAFDRVQVSHVELCRLCRSPSEAGRLLFSASRGCKSDYQGRRPPAQIFELVWNRIPPPCDRPPGLSPTDPR
jgi:sigma54-dependent transcription regulator